MIRVLIFRIFSLSKIPPMKKFLLVVFIATLRLHAQQYIYSDYYSPYTELSGATTLTTSTPWSYATSYNVPIGFTFEFRSTNFTSINVEGSGFAFFDPSYYYLALPFCVKLQSKGTSGNNSPISYQTIGAAGSRILKIQWKNAGFYYDTTSTINFQLWLYETSNYLEVHVGPNDVPNPSLVYQENGSDGPVIGVFHYTSASNCTYSIALTGNPVTPLGIPATGNINLFANSLSSTPPDSMVYRFEPYYLGVNEHSSEALFASNIVSDVVNFHSVVPVRLCVLYSMDGKMCVQRSVANQQLFIGDLPAGMYILEAQIEGVISRQKLMISR
jgi:hypothetical protein